jgi:ATP-binding cassette subfamily F protein 2
MKKFRWEQEQMSHMKEYIARFGHGSAKLARQAQSKEKTLAKMVGGAHHTPWPWPWQLPQRRG